MLTVTITHRRGAESLNHQQYLAHFFFKFIAVLSSEKDFKQVENTPMVIRKHFVKLQTQNNTLTFMVKNT